MAPQIRPSTKRVKRRANARDNPVGPSENGGARPVGTASRHGVEPENGGIRKVGVATTDPFAASFRAKDALEAIPPEWQSNAGTSKGKSLMRPQDLASCLLPASIGGTLH